MQVTALGDGEYYTNSSATAQSEITVNSASVTISVVRADGKAFAENNQPVITLTMADGTTTIAFANGETKPLPLGQYTYTVKAKTFGTLNSSFELTAEGKTLNLTMAYSAVWDGETTLKPSQDDDGTYLISNSYELAWFRDQVNGQLTNGYTSCMLNAKLSENIDLGNHDWTAIAKVTDTSESKGYAGTFNGDGHTISNLKPVGSEVTSYNNTKIQGAGLFGYVYVGGTVQNVTVSGTLNAVQYSGGVVAILAGGTVENCVSSMHVTSELSTNVFAGGIVGNINSKGTAPRVIGCRNDGIIEGGTNSYVGGITGQVSNSAALISNCTNTAAVSGKERIGGIVGSSSAAITACWNTGSVTGTSDEIGGIAGFSSGDTRNCYNSGDVAGVGKTNGVGGIVDRLQSENGGKVTGCLVSGSVTASGEYFGAIVGSKGGTSSVITRSYYLNTSSTKAIGSNAAETDETTPVTADELGAKRLIGLLGGAFASGSDGKLVLNWQDAQSKPVVSFVVPDGATVTVTGQSAAANEPGVYVLTDGTYTYTVSKTGYNAKTDEFAVSGESQSIEVSLEAETFQVTFNVQPDGAKIVVRSEAGEEVAPTQESASIYSLPNGKYTYADAETPETPAQTEGPDTAEPADKQSEDTSPEGGRTLVVYYSASGNTAAVTGYIADALGADTFELVPETPYSSDDLNWTVNGSRVNREHDDESLRDIALVADSVDNWDEYDTVFIGYPIWWAIAAWPVNNFVKNNDFTGKTVIPVCTSSSSGLGQSGDLLENMANGGTWQSGQRFSSGASSSSVREWAAGLGL